MNKIKAIIVIMLVIGAYAYASNEDYKAEQMEHAHACEMVKNGAWPKSFCEGGK